MVIRLVSTGKDVLLSIGLWISYNGVVYGVVGTVSGDEQDLLHWLGPVAAELSPLCDRHWREHFSFPFPLWPYSVHLCHGEFNVIVM